MHIKNIRLRPKIYSKRRNGSSFLGPVKIFFGKAYKIGSSYCTVLGGIAESTDKL
jgi:hypothetical protein